VSEVTLLETTHQYFHNPTGRELIAVSKAFELIGITDFSKVPFERLEPARLKGDYVHELGRLYGIGIKQGAQILDEASVEPEFQGYLEAIKAFYQNRVKRVIAVEEPVYDLKRGYAGTPDLIYEDPDGVICLDDYKTPLKIHPATKWQTAAYAVPAERIYRIKIDKRHGVMLKADGTYLLDPHKNSLRQDFNSFMTILGAAYLKIENKIK
jgi:hypothetical protein